MRAYRFDRFGIDHLRLQDVEPTEPGPGQVAVDVKAISLNYRDLLVVTGKYNPKLLDKGGSKTPMSDGSGVIGAVGEGV
ncbi:MAG: alcohol dehydrogenase catalytic domain-containing protein, partial [Phycisphaerae bacterium]